jgi:hypothetical protein
MSLNRREILRYGAIGAGAAMLSSAARPLPFHTTVSQPVTGPIGRPLPAAPRGPMAPAGVNPQLFERAIASLNAHRIHARDSIGIVDFSLASRDPRFHVVDLRDGSVESFRVTHGKGSDPSHCGFLDHFSNTHGSEATSNGTYTTGDYYHGKYGLSMKLHGHDWSNNNALGRAIVIHNAWYAEPGVIDAHGKLGRSQGCFAFSRDDQWAIMRKLAGGRMIYADKLA